MNKKNENVLFRWAQEIVSSSVSFDELKCLVYIWNCSQYVVAFYWVSTEIFRNLFPSRCSQSTFQAKWAFSTDKWLFRIYSQYAGPCNNANSSIKIFMIAPIFIEVLSENINYWHCQGQKKNLNWIPFKSQFAHLS